ncbi:hypothetical protein C1A40_16280 [Tamlana carrageenivorans]|nr:hypothetical protein C1A40_16280 [Tamlana carrageenivorans]
MAKQNVKQTLNYHSCDFGHITIRKQDDGLISCMAKQNVKQTLNYHSCDFGHITIRKQDDGLISCMAKQNVKQTLKILNSTILNSQLKNCTVKEDV